MYDVAHISPPKSHSHRAKKKKGRLIRKSQAKVVNPDIIIINKKQASKITLSVTCQQAS